MEMEKFLSKDSFIFLPHQLYKFCVNFIRTISEDTECVPTPGPPLPGLPE